MSFLKDLGLDYNPFDIAINHDADIFESRDLTEIQERVSEAFMQRQLLWILGPAMAGKTTGVFNLLLEDDPHILLVRDITLSWETLNIHQIEEAILTAIWERTKQPEKIAHTANRRYHQLRRVLGSFAQEHEVVLVLEDGHKIPTETLVNLKRIREMRWLLMERLLTIIVLSQPQMRMRMKTIREVAGRSQVLELQGLNREEVRGYLDHRLGRAGVKTKQLFDTKALNLISEYLHWPGEINKACETMLRRAAETGIVPVNEDLAREQCNARTTLTGLWLASGMSIGDVYRELDRKGCKAAPITIKRALLGLDTEDAKLLGLLREVLMPFAGDMASLYSADRPGLTAEQARMIDECGRMIQDLGDDFRIALITRSTGLSERRIFELLKGIRVEQAGLEGIHRRLTGLVKQKKAA